MGPEVHYSSSRYQLLKCKSCELLTVDPIPTMQEIEDYYASEAINDEAWYDISKMRDLQEQIIAKPTASMQFLKKHFQLSSGDEGKALEIGCNSGYFLEYLQTEFPSWEFEGVELNQSCVDFCRKREKFKLYDKPLEKLGLAKESYDSIMLYHVLEHIQYPDQFLKEVYPLLKTGGSLHLAVPNTGNLNAKVMGHLKRLRGKEEWYSMCPPFHLHAFNKENLKQLGEVMGFEFISGTPYHHEPFEGTYEGEKIEIKSFNHFIGRSLSKLLQKNHDECLLVVLKKN